MLAGFSEGFATVSLNHKEGAIDRFGRVRISLLYDWLYPMKNGLMEFQKGNTQGYIDSAGRIIWQSTIN